MPPRQKEAKMSGVSKAVSTALYEKVVKSLQEVSKSGDISRKLQAIKSAKECGITMVSKVFGISRVTLMSWISNFEKHGTDGLKLKTGRGRKSILSEKEKGIVKEWLSVDNTLTIKAVKIKIAETFEKNLSLSTTHLIMKGLSFSYITPRPKHHKQDKSLHVKFKKKSGKAAQEEP
jgi:transposase